jgi:hypothetical protein
MTSKTPLMDSFIKDHKPPEKIKEPPATKEQVQGAKKILTDLADKFGGKE